MRQTSDCLNTSRHGIGGKTELEKTTRERKHGHAGSLCDWPIEGWTAGVLLNGNERGGNPRCLARTNSSPLGSSSEGAPAKQKTPSSHTGRNILAVAGSDNVPKITAHARVEGGFRRPRRPTNNALNTQFFLDNSQIRQEPSQVDWYQRRARFGNY